MLLWGLKRRPPSPSNPEGLRPQLQDGPRESVRGLCRRLRSARRRIQSPACWHRIAKSLRQPTDPNRLEFGLSFGSLRQTVEDKLGPISPLDFHKSLDSLIDAGVIVPRYLCQEVNGHSIWYRCFRVGEGQAAVRAHVVKECFEVLSQVMRTVKLRETLSEKFLLLVCNLHDVFRDPGLAATPGIERGFHLYGGRPQIEVGGHLTWLIDWARKRRIITQVEESGSRYYSLSDSAHFFFEGREPFQFGHQAASDFISMVDEPGR